MEVEVGRDEFVLFDIGHHFLDRSVLVAIEVSSLGHTADSTADFKAALRVNGVNLAFQQILVVYYRGGGASHRRGKEGKQRSFHFHIHF